MIKFNPGLSQILSKVFFSKNSHVTQTFKILLSPYSEKPYADGARGAAAPPNFGQLRFFGQQEKILSKTVFKDVSMIFLLYLRDKYFLF